MKPYYDEGGITLYCASSVRHMPVTGDSLITDPPYGTGYYAADVDCWGSLASWLGAYTTSAVFGYPEALVAWCVRNTLEPAEWVTWWPTNKASGHRAVGLARETEHIAIFGDVTGGQRIMRPRSWKSANRVAEAFIASRGLDGEQARMGDVWRDPAPGMAFNHAQRLHPNEKPLDVMRRLVEMCSAPGGVVVDPFAGSGTTLRAAKDLGRRAVGFEVNEEHCEVIVSRLGQEVLDFGEAA